MAFTRQSLPRKNCSREEARGALLLDRHSGVIPEHWPRRASSVPAVRQGSVSLGLRLLPLQRSASDHLIVRFWRATRGIERPGAAAALAVVVLFPAAAFGAQAAARSAGNRPLAGSLDPSFGRGGVVPQSPSSAIAVQPDGKIVVAAGSSAGFVLARYLPDGSLDPSFGTGGQVETDVGAGPFGALALQPDGKIVVAGGSTYGSTNQFTLARFDSNGSLDTSFGTDGSTNTVIPTSLDASWYPWGAGVAALAVLPDGKVLAAGSALWNRDLYDYDGGFVLARYTPAGSLDPTFGDGGIVETFDGDTTLAGIVVLPDGRIDATGTSNYGHPYYFSQIAVAGYEPDGSLDFPYPPPVPVGRMSGGPSTLQHGKVVVAGSIQHGQLTFPLVARYRANGRLDSTFGRHGYAEVKRAQFAPSAILRQDDGKFLLAGDGTVLRLLPNGRLDPSFGARGIVTLGTTTSSLALQQDGKILVGGQTLDRLVGGNNCVVPGLRGKTVPKANAKLKASHCLSGRIAKRFSSTVRRGRVVSTMPARAARLPGGTKVDLIVSKGKRR
jgi:uncharacterized delta-60 repeat protein